MKYLLRYVGTPDFLTGAREHGAAHVARLTEFAARGLLLGAGPLDEPLDGDALGIFTTREAAEEFVAGDPFVRHGVVASWSVRAWRDSFG